ncbi:MAG: hypothetical protein ABIK28_10180, partial [Planctomycetota bacterium]
RLPMAVMLILVFSAPLMGATFMVTSTADTLTPGTLRYAITQANNNPFVFDIIQFNINGGGAWTIMPMSQLPPLTDPAGVLIDGLSQPGASAGANPPATANLLIEINGMFAGFAHGLWVQSDANTIQGLVINNFQWDGIRIEGGLANFSANMNRVYCSFIGTDLMGMADQGNGLDTTNFFAGIHVCNVPDGIALDNIIDGNLVSGNWAEGVWIEGPRQPGDVGRSLVTENYIGTEITGTMDLGNDHEGVCMSEGAHDNQVIHNLVSGNDYDGIGMQGFNNYPYPAPPIQTSKNLITLNIIGMDIHLNQANPIPNTFHGVAIGEYGPGQWGCADYNMVIENVIAFNGTDGVAVYEDWINNFNADHNLISRNSIFKNNGLGIDLGNNSVTFNDVGDGDTGANEEVNFPVIAGINYNAGTTSLMGFVDTPNPQTATIELFMARPDPMLHGEGEWFVGSTIPDAAGNWNFSTQLLVPGDWVTATTTDQSSNSSEFCLNVQVPGSPTLWSMVRTIPMQEGGYINFALTAGPGNANRWYLLIGGVSGILPGTLLPGGMVTLPVNMDAFTSFFLFPLLNTPVFANFLGQLDPLGNASAQLNTLGPLPPTAVGLYMHYAYCMNNPFNFASNPVAIEIMPW